MPYQIKAKSIRIGPSHPRRVIEFIRADIAMTHGAATTSKEAVL
jgi:hypothetical protein